MAGKQNGHKGVAESGQAIEVIPVDELHIDPANVRRHPDKNMAAIKASLARFGQQHPIVIDANNVVRAGNGRLEAMRELGWATVNCVRSELAPIDLMAFSLADNHSGELAEWDFEGLGATLRALKSEEFDLSTIGFTDEEVDGLFGRRADESGDVVDDPQAEWQGMPECENGDESPHRTLIVHFATPEAVAEFAGLIGQQFADGAKYIWHPRLKLQHPSATPYVDEP